MPASAASTPLPSDVSAADIAAAVARYRGVVPPKLAELDAFRYTELPQRVAKRLADRGHVVIDKDELVRLVDWKLHHGTYRPALLSQVKSNAEALVDQTIREAVGELQAQLAGDTTAQGASKAVLQAVNALSKPLRGIGPATASLVLAVCLPGRAPFFSDELWRWSVHADKQRSGQWVQAKIGYSVKEYGLMLASVRAVQDRLASTETDAMPDAVELEQAAYVWAREVNGKASELHGAPNKSSSRSDEATTSQQTPGPSKKRKSELSQSNGRTRSSTRRKM